MPAWMLVEVAVGGLEYAGKHVVLAPGWVVLRFVLWRPASRVRYDSYASAVAGALVWLTAVVVGLAALAGPR